LLEANKPYVCSYEKRKFVEQKIINRHF
jgi:hypothetical protein